MLYSADCFGVVMCWELKTTSNLCSWELGPLPVNKLAIDPAGKKSYEYNNVCMYVYVCMYVCMYVCLCRYSVGMWLW